MFQSLGLYDNFKSSPLALLFPPVTSRGRFLIHKTVEEYFPELGSVSIGEGLDRRTLVTWSRLIQKQDERNQAEAKRKLQESRKSPEPPINCITESRNMEKKMVSNVSENKNAKDDRRGHRQAAPIYTPPGARGDSRPQSRISANKEPHHHGTHRDGFDSFEDIHTSMRNRYHEVAQSPNHRKPSKRPDRALYVPRGRRSCDVPSSPTDENFTHRPVSPANSICSVVSEFSGQKRYNPPRYNNRNSQIREEWPNKGDSRPSSRNSSYLMERCLNQNENSFSSYDRDADEYRKGGQSRRNSHHKENFHYSTESGSPRKRNERYTNFGGQTPPLNRTNSWNNVSQSPSKRNHKKTSYRNENDRQNWKPRQSYRQKDYWQHEVREPERPASVNCMSPRRLPISPRESRTEFPNREAIGHNRTGNVAFTSGIHNDQSQYKTSTPNRSQQCSYAPSLPANDGPVNDKSIKSLQKSSMPGQSFDDFSDAMKCMTSSTTELATSEALTDSISDDTSLNTDSFASASSKINETDDFCSTSETSVVEPELDPKSNVDSILEPSTALIRDLENTTETSAAPLHIEESSVNPMTAETPSDVSPLPTENDSPTLSEKEQVVPSDSPPKMPIRSPMKWSDYPEDSWDLLYDDTGNNIAVVQEVKKVVKAKVSIKEPTNDYKEFEADDTLVETRYSNVVEIYDFASSFETKDMLSIFQEFKHMDIRWVDDTHALGIFETKQAASALLDFKHPFVKVRPLSMATSQSKAKAMRSTDGLLPHKSRPQTSATLARRLVGSALGLKVDVPKEIREAERKKMRDAKETRRRVAKQKVDAWEGTIRNMAGE